MIVGRWLGNNAMMGEASAAVEGAVPVVEARLLDARTLVLLHFDFVWRLLRRLGVEEADVDDAAQQVFLVATRRTATIAPGRERAFLYGTALRLAATLRRNVRRRRRWVETRPADCASPEGTPHDELERRQALALLDEVLGELSDDLRVVFVLSELEELTTPEVASLIGVPIGTVASRLRRARKEFSDRLRRLQGRPLRKSW